MSAEELRGLLGSLWEGSILIDAEYIPDAERIDAAMGVRACLEWAMRPVREGE